MSTAVNAPERLFSTWVTPMIWSARLRSATHNMLRVRNPVRRSTSALKRGSR